MIFLKKIKNVMLLARCMIKALVYGRTDKVPKNISRIIVMPDGKLGDVVCCTPVLVAIRENFSNAHVIVGGNVPFLKALLADSGLVDEYLELGGNENTIEQIKKCHANAALLTGPSFESAASMYLAGIPFIVAPRVVGGFSPYETRPYKVLQRFVKTFSYRMGAYAPRERLRALEPLGIVSDDTQKHLGFSEMADKKIEQFFVDNSIEIKKDFVVGISSSAGNKIKEWPEERFAEVADYLIEKYHARVILIGGPRDDQKTKKVLTQMKNAGVVINSQGKFNLDELKAFISKIGLFISVDTGPIYIAEAFNVSTVNIVGPMNEHEQPP